MDLHNSVHDGGNVDYIFLPDIWSQPNANGLRLKL